MKQMNVADEYKIDFDYDAPNVPEMAKVLRPVIYKDGNSFSCLLGPNPEEGVFGSGHTAEEAVTMWAAVLTEHISNCKLDKQVTEYVREVLDAISKDNATTEPN